MPFDDGFWDELETQIGIEEALIRSKAIEDDILIDYQWSCT